MQREKMKSQGRKTHEQFLRNLEHKDDVPKAREADDLEGQNPDGTQVPHDRDARQSEMPVSRGGMNQESRQHNKHNNPGQSGHKPQKHSPAEEGH
jgi:hypothetical protein